MANTISWRVYAILPDGCPLLEDCPCQPVAECNPEEGCELIQELFTAGSNGQVNLKIDLLQTGDETHPPIDPRGKLISICQDSEEGSEVVMSAWFYGAADDDPSHTKVKEQTELDPVDENTQGTVSARYDMGPNGKGGLNMQLQNVAPGTYQIYVDGDPLTLDGSTPAELIPNPGGIAKLSLGTQPGKGKGRGKVKEHNKKGTLSIDPRRKLIELIELGETSEEDVLAFCGPMLAQIPNLNDGDLAAETVALMELGPEQMSGAGEVTTGVEEGCDSIFAVAVSGLLAGDYALCVDGDPIPEVILTVAEDGRGELRFEEKPETDEPEELLLSFPVGSGSVIGVTQWDPDPMAVDCTTPVLSVTLP